MCDPNAGTYCYGAGHLCVNGEMYDDAADCPPEAGSAVGPCFTIPDCAW